MTRDLSDHPFAIVSQLETAALQATPFERWAERVEAMLGHSLDTAYDAYRAGVSALNHACAIARARNTYTLRVYNRRAAQAGDWEEMDVLTHANCDAAFWVMVALDQAKAAGRIPGVVYELIRENRA